ncbi:MAG TPA: DUF1553 domain-containing protein [Verrucomicrobiae bacterium]|nr:DUF1553 domain-containing protein [Verrucomicrobiae bacterium]
MNTRRMSAQNWGSSLAASLCLLTYTSLGAELTSSTKARLWSLQPLQQPAIPHFSASNPADANPIDAFVRAKLDEKGLQRAPPADRRTLIRRLYFDLTGLPPTPEQIDAFVADPGPRAYAKLVDHLLDSPRYGERWARHWLDVVHYGETHGYDKDKPRPNAWPYRDYVIRAFNEDKPYARFVQEQLAGDVLFPGTRDGIEALGFIAAGPWDLIGHEEVPETKIDGKIARHLDRDDMVMNTMQTFNSLTVQCAQCHDHKFDPIAQADYYRLQAVFAAIDRTNKKYDPDPAVAQQRAELEARQQNLARQQKTLEDKIVARAGDALKELDKKLAAAEQAANNGAAYGYHSNIEKSPDVTKWVQIDLGRSIPLGSLTLHPCKDDFNHIGEGFGFPVRFRMELSEDPAFQSGVTLVADQTSADFPNPKLNAPSYDAHGRAGRYIRVTATQLALRQDDYIFALAELTALTADGHNAARGAAVTALDSIEAPARWQRNNLTDGWYPGLGAKDSGEAALLRQQRQDLLAQATPSAEADQLAQLERDAGATKAALEKLPPLQTAYVGAVHTGSGSFTGTGATGGKPRPIHILLRGNVQKPGDLVEPAALPAVATLPATFDLPKDHTEGDRRAALARWLTDPRNPLSWRSIVNRVWQYHFGHGLVETPNDFGHMGAVPTHPELLDWLASTFRDQGQSLKQLHRLIVTSATYQQQSQGATTAADSAAALDPDNRYLWRQTRRKLEAEAVRDAMLLVAGCLDLKMGGPSFQDFVIDKPEHSPHYEYHLSNPEDAKTHRRSIYRFIVRSQPQPFMNTLDCADPSMQVARRNESVSPLQALALLNNSLVLTMSKHFAAKLQEQPGDLPAKVARAYTEATGRDPSPAAQEVLTSYAGEFGLTNLCRVLFNLNEFTFVD